MPTEKERERDRKRYAKDRDKIRQRQAESKKRRGSVWLENYRSKYAASPERQTKAIWKTMISRCTDPRHSAYKYYGAEGISVCPRWSGSLGNFIADMGLRPAKMSIDRINGRLGYEPGNCRWATRSQQMLNKRLSINQIPRCTCGGCRACKNRAATVRSQAKRKAREGA